jgi:hypothetical protein
MAEVFRPCSTMQCKYYCPFHELLVNHRFYFAVINDLSLISVTFMDKAQPYSIDY